MPNLNELLEKKLNKNYLKVQKMELEVYEKSDSLLDAFSKNIDEIKKELKNDFANAKTLEKDIEDKLKKDIISVKEEEKKNIEDIKNKSMILKAQCEEDISKIKIIRDAEIANINTVIEQLNKDYLKLSDTDVKKQLDNDLASIDLKIEKGKENFQAETDELKKKLLESKIKNEEEIEKITAEKNKKIAGISDTLNNKIELLTSEIENEENNVKLHLEEEDLEYHNGLKVLENEISYHQEQSDKKVEAIKSTLDSKISRHEKFMEKNIKENDQRAAKQHRKEILILQKNREKELRQLEIEVEEKSKGDVLKHKEYVKQYFEKLSKIAKKLAEYKQRKFFEIANEQAISNSEVDRVKLEYSRLILEKQHVMDELTRDYDNELAEIVRKNELFLQALDNERELLNIEYDKSNIANKQKLVQDLAVHEKSLKKTEIDYSSKLEELNVNLKISLTSNEYDIKVLKKKSLRDLEILKRNEQIEYYNIDMKRQVSAANELVLYQTKVSDLFESREKHMFDYEEIEINNRFDLKVKFNEDQLSQINKEQVESVKKLETAYQDEKVIYLQQKTIASKDLITELVEYENSTQQELDKLIEEKNSLHPKKDKNELKIVERNITDKLEELRFGIESRKNNISSKNDLFDKGLEQVESRRDLAMNELNTFYSNTILRLQVQIDYLQSERTQELQNAKRRYESTINDAKNLISQATAIKDTLVIESTSFLNARVQNEYAFVKTAQNIFLKQNEELQEELDSLISEFQSEIQKISNNRNSSLNEIENEYNTIVENSKRMLDNTEYEFEQVLARQNSVLNSANKEIEQKCTSELSRISSTFSERVNIKNTKLQEIVRSIANQDKNLESVKKTVKLDYDIALSKELASLDQKLIQDLKTI